MNNTKKKLILASSIIQFISVAILLFTIVFFIRVSNSALENMFEEYSELGWSAETIRTVMLSVTGVGFAFQLIAAILLVCSIRDEGRKFNQSKAMFITGVVFTAITSPLSIASILLYIALSIKEQAQANMFYTIQPQQNVVRQNEFQDISVDNTNIKKTILKYQGLKNDGLISEEEYKKILIKYLRELKNSGNITQEQFENLLTKLI